MPLIIGPYNETIAKEVQNVFKVPYAGSYYSFLQILGEGGVRRGSEVRWGPLKS